MTINMRRRYDLYLTNTKDNSPGAGPYVLAMPDSPTSRGTPRQLLAEILEFRRKSGQGAFTAEKIIDPKSGARFSFDDLRDAVSEAECRS